jgi:hypothetical protein
MIGLIIFPLSQRNISYTASLPLERNHQFFCRLAVISTCGISLIRFLLALLSEEQLLINWNFQALLLIPKPFKQ